MEERIVLDRLVISLGPLVPVDQLRQENLDLEQGKVETDTSSLALCKGDVRRSVAVLDLFGVPSVGVESCRVVPELGVVVDVVESGDHNAALGDLVAAGEDEVNLGRATRLVGRVVLSLHLLYVFVQEGELGDGVGVQDAVFGDVVVDHLLQEAFLHAWVCHQSVQEP